MTASLAERMEPVVSMVFASERSVCESAFMLAAAPLSSCGPALSIRSSSESTKAPVSLRVPISVSVMTVTLPSADWSCGS